ncbi:synaptotagmin-4 isoform X2 [Amia ocellicauda]|uniref:synaptotagmin-4 isoform X2 n=1 Tax=Amia ocellicauda TaxID=2972642 RepID=UPI003464272C
MDTVETRDPIMKEKMPQFALEVHLQVLLGVGLAVFCFCLILGCIICWRRRKSHSEEEKASPPTTEQVVLDLSANLSPCSSAAASTTPIKQQYEELEGDVLDYPFPSAYSCSAPSEQDFGVPPPSPRPRSSSELGSRFPLQQLSSPSNEPSPPYQPCLHGRASLPSIPKLSLVSKTKRALERRCTVTGDGFIYSERSKLTGSGTRLFPPQNVRQSRTLPEELSEMSPKPPPCLHFSLLYSPAQGTLTVTVISLVSARRKLGGVYVRLSLLPHCPNRQQTSVRRRSLSPEFRENFLFEVGSVEELKECCLHLNVFAKDFPSLRDTHLGEVMLACREVEWESNMPMTFNRELVLSKGKLKKSQSSQEAYNRRTSMSSARPLGQLFILLQYQTLAHRIKVMVRKAENLVKLTRMPGAPDHYVVINLRQDGMVIGSKETKMASGCNAVWNAPFLFDMPPGEIQQLPVSLEFIVMQGRIYTKSSILGRVLIGHDAPEAGQGHWKDMCCRGQVESARWHAIQPDCL